MTQLDAPHRDTGGSGGIEVLIREAQRHGRRRHAIYLAVVVVVVALLASVLVAVALASSSPGATTSPQGATVPAAVAAQTSASTLGPLPPGIASLSGLSCTTAQRCVAVGGGGVGDVDDAVVLLTVDGGTTWTRSRVPASAQGLSTVACRATTCIAGGATVPGTDRPEVLRSSNGGGTWTGVALPASTKASVVRLTACSTPRRCVVVSGIDTYVTTTAGVTWRLARGAPRVLGALDCPTATVCTAVAQPADPSNATWSYSTWRSSDGGASWTKVGSVRGFSSPTDLDCTTPGTCTLLVAAPGTRDTELARTTDGGSSWQTSSLPVRFADVATCTSAAACTVWQAPQSFQQLVAAFRTVDAGTTWSRLGGYPSSVIASAASCDAAARCEVLGTDPLGVEVLGSSNGGRTWSSQALPPGVLRVEATACTTLERCVVGTEANHGGAVYTTDDGGTDWTNRRVPSGTPPVTAMTCTTATFCAGVAGGILVSEDGGATWTRTPYHLGREAELDSISCASTSTCMIVGGVPGPGNAIGPPSLPRVGSSLVLRWHGGTLERVRVPRADALLTSVACPTATTCVAVGMDRLGLTGQAAVMTSSNAGRSWSIRAIGDDVDALSGVACPSPLVCVAAGQWLRVPPGTEPGILQSTNGGRTWREVPLVHRIGEMAAVACASATDCVALGDALRHHLDGDVTMWLHASFAGGPLTATLLSPPDAYRTIGELLDASLFAVRSTASNASPRVVRAG